MQELELIKINTLGETDPFIPFGTNVLLIQNGFVQVGRLNSTLNNHYSFFIDHPLNEVELNTEAMKIISEKKPEYLRSTDALIVICPDEISKEIIW